MDVIALNDKIYGLLITRDEASVEITVWHGEQQQAMICIDEDGVHALDAKTLNS